MSKFDNNTELWLSYLVGDAPASSTIKDILKGSKKDLLLAMKESVSKKGIKKFSIENPNLVAGILKISKPTLLSDKFSNGFLDEAIFLTLSFSKGQDLLDNLKIIALNNNIHSDTRIKTINNRMKKYSDNKKIFFLLELYTCDISYYFQSDLKSNIMDNINNGKRSIYKKLFLLLKLYKNNSFSSLSGDIKNLILNELKNKNHSINNISKVLTNIWSDLSISDKIDIFLLRGVNNFPGLIKKFKDEIIAFFNPDGSKYFGQNIYNIYDNGSIICKDGFIEMIFNFDDNDLTWFLILVFYKNFESRRDIIKLLDYFKKNNNKKFGLNMLNLSK